jgi:uncharacterized membrane protein
MAQPDEVASPTAKADHGLASVLERNIRVLDLRRQYEEKTASLEERVADTMTAFAGSMWSVYLHLALFGFWIIANIGWIPGVPIWDPTLVVLAMIASVEAIFLSTFVLISQNRMAAAEKRRADLDLQINLLAEHEVTRLIEMVSAIVRKLEVTTGTPPDIDELKKDIRPEAVLDHIEASGERGASG